MNRKQEVLKIAEEIVRKKNELRALEAQYDELWDGPKARIITPHELEKPSSGESIAKQIEAHLKAKKGAIVDSQDLTEAFPGVRKKTIYATLSWLANKKGRVEAVDRGKYKYIGDKANPALE